MQDAIKHSQECTGEVMSSEKELLSAKQAASYLDISMAQLYKLTSKRSIPFYQPTGGKLYFNRVELNEWVWSHKVKTAAVIEEEAANYLFTNKKVA